MKRFTLSRPERITRTSDFKQALINGSFYNGKALKLNVSHNSCGFPRIGVSLRKYIFKLAVTRNKLRRSIREIFRTNKGKFGGGYDLIATPKAAASGMPYIELEKEFMALVKKAGISRSPEVG